MRAVIEGARPLHFDDGAPVRSASAMAPFAGGWLVAQDDATHAAWLRSPSSVVAVRVFPTVDGHEVFASAEGTKHLKPDVEAACEVTVDGAPAVLLLGSGSTPRRMRSSLVRRDGDGHRFDVADLGPLYERVAAVLGVAPDRLNLEGACRLGGSVRWFNRGNAGAGVPSASVDLDLVGLVAAATGTAAAGDVGVGNPLRHDLGSVGGVGLAVTDAVALPDGRVLLSAAAEDTPNAVDDGPVVGSALCLAHEDELVATADLGTADGTVHKVEGLGLREVLPDGVRLVAVVDVDDPLVPSVELTVRVTW